MLKIANVIVIGCFLYFISACNHSKKADKVKEFDRDEIFVELKREIKLPYDFLANWDDSTFEIEFSDEECQVGISTVSKEEFITKMKRQSSKISFFDGLTRINELSDNRVFRMDSCVYFVTSRRDTVSICDSLFDFSGGRFLFKGYNNDFILIQSRGNKLARCLLINASLWEIEKVLPFATVFSLEKRRLFSTEWPMSYSNLKGDTFFGQHGRFYVHSLDKQNVLKKFDSMRVFRTNSDSILLSSLTYPFFVSDSEIYAVMNLFENGELDYSKVYCVSVTITSSS